MRQAQAYELAFRLDTESAKTLVGTQLPVDLYITSLAETIELLVTERDELFNLYEKHFFERQEKRQKYVSAEDIFLQAEIHLHWAFVYLKFGHEFDAAMTLRKAYRIAESCKKEYPDFLPIRKTSGLLQIMIGSVPDKYSWILSLFGMQGSVEAGLADLRRISETDSPMAFEAKLLLALLKGFIFQQPEKAMPEISLLLSSHPKHKLLLFLASSIAVKNFESEQAEKWLDQHADITNGLPLHYRHYLHGEVLLHKGDYSAAINAYENFLRRYKGNNYIKDSNYKIAVCHYLAGNREEALKQFEVAQTAGIENTEADRFAARAMAQTELPNIPLSKIRYFTDGGYYDKARDVIDQYAANDFATKHDRVEYHYRKARLAHKQGKSDESKQLYEKTISEAGDETWYFAPNASLQLGYIYLGEGNETVAVRYFEKAIAYRKHAYKNSIDSKARSALDQIKRK